MFVGGTVAIGLIIGEVNLPFQLDANVFGLTASIVSYIAIYWILAKKNRLF